MTKAGRRRALDVALAVTAGLSVALASLLMARGSLDALLAVLFAAGVLIPHFMTRRPWLTGPAVLFTIVCVVWTMERPSIAFLTVLAAWIGTAVGLSTIPRRRSPLAGVWPTIFCILLTAWLAWPIWLAPQLVVWQVEIPTWMIRLHPLFAANTAELQRGIWTEQPNAYALTPLGQDVAYALPSSVWPAVLLHGGIAIVSLLIASLRDRFQSRTVA